jgi:hypothetical protein
LGFRASNEIPADALSKAKKLALQYRSYMQTKRAAFAAGTDAQTVLACYFDSLRFRSAITAIGSTPGLVAFAQAQENDGGYDVVTEVNAMIAAVDAVTAEIASLYPEDGSGYLLDRQFSVDGSAIEYRAFTAPQLATLTSLADAVIAEIE